MPAAGVGACPLPLYNNNLLSNVILVEMIVLVSHQLALSCNEV
jgi:hypothetical protein